MSTVWYGDQLIIRLRNTTAEGLLLAAETLRANHYERLGVPNLPPYHNSSKPGEYPRKRSGVGRDNITISPATLEEAVRTLHVRVGFHPRAWYMVFLEKHRQRLGLEATLRELSPLLRRLVTQKLRKG